MVWAKRSIVVGAEDAFSFVISDPDDVGKEMARMPTARNA
jgi:hypothetical protein